MSQDENQTYLGLLKFDPKLLKTPQGRYLKNIRLMVLWLLVVVILGFGAFTSLPRTLNPEVNIPYIVVSTILPGSGPEEIESLITDPLEKEIKRVKGVNNFSSSSQENFSLITVEFDASYKTKEARDEIQSAVEGVTDLPDDATTPQVIELDFENVPVWDFMLVGKNSDVDLASLNRLATDIKNEVEEVPSVDRVEITGMDEREIQLFIKPEIIEERGIGSPILLSQAISNALSAYPAGNIHTSGATFALSIDQPATSLEQLRNTPVTFDDQNYKLSDLAEIKETSTFDQAQSFLTHPESEAQRAISFSVYKTTGGRVDVARNDTRDVLEEIMSDKEERFEIKTINDYAQMIDDQFLDLGENFIQTLLLVFLSMFLLYGIRQALIASVAIPFSLLIVFASMSFMGISLNFLSIFSLLIALGLFVDNAVVIIEGYTSYYGSGKFTPLETSLLVFKDFFVELFSINLLTCWAFLPLLITSGIMGEFIKPLPIIVSISMMGSVVVAFLFTLPSMMLLSDFKMARRVQIFLKLVGVLFGLGLVLTLIPKTPFFLPTLVVVAGLTFVIWLLRKNLLAQIKKIASQKQISSVLKFANSSLDSGLVSLESVSGKYRQILVKLLSSRKARIQTIIVIVAFTIFSYLLVPLGFVPNEFFPEGDQESVEVTLELPAGTNLEITTHEALNILDYLKKVEGVKFATAQIGQGGSSRAFNVGNTSSHLAAFNLRLVDEKERESSIDISQQIRDEYTSFYTKGKLQVSAGESGPPAGADIEIQIAGSDLDQLQIYADDVIEFLESLEGTTNVNKSIKPGLSKIVFEPDVNKLQTEGLTEGQIALWLRTYVSGFTLGETNFLDEERSIVMKMAQDTLTPKELTKLRIPLGKESVALGELGALTLKPNPTLITHRDGKRTITISASALPGYLPPELNRELEKFANGDLALESGYAWKTGGANEENQESMNSIVQAMGISAILILVTMVVQLGSFRKALIVMLVIPLALSGVFIWFALTQTPISFPAMIGMLSLFGIVIANSLMVVDKVGKNQEAGMKMKESIIDAAASRLEPILLTSVSQIIGLIPITLSDPLWRGLGGAIIAGLSFSGTIMLFFIPMVYFYLFPEGEEN